MPDEHDDPFLMQIRCRVNAHLSWNIIYIFVYQKSVYYTNISNQLFEYKITFVNSQREKTN